MVKLLTFLIFGVAILSMLLFDYTQGIGVSDVLKKLFCKVVCVVRKAIRDENLDLNLPVLLSEITFLGLTMAFLRKLRQTPAKDRIDDLLEESWDALKQTDEFLEKWRVRKINWQTPNHCPYLDEEPQELEPYRLEVPILHMAIVDTIGGRGQFERGDSGDTITIADSTLLSMTSLLDDDLLSIPEEEKVSSSGIDVSSSVLDVSNIEDNRCLWDVMEEPNDEELCQ